MRVGKALDTYSANATLVGLALAARPQTRKAGGLLLLSVGWGFVAILHDRISGARFSGYKRPHLETVQLRSVAAHLGVGLLGWRILRGQK